MDNSEQAIQQATTQTLRTLPRAGAVILRQARQTARTVWRAARAQVARRREHARGGQVSMRRFAARSRNQSRDVVRVDDPQVARAMQQDLTRRRVEFARERNEGGRVVLHFRSTDANLVADSLERAAERVDAQRGAATRQPLQQRVQEQPEIGERGREAIAPTVQRDQAQPRRTATARQPLQQRVQERSKAAKRGRDATPTRRITPNRAPRRGGAR